MMFHVEHFTIDFARHGGLCGRNPVPRWNTLRSILFIMFHVERCEDRKCVPRGTSESHEQPICHCTVCVQLVPPAGSDFNSPLESRQNPRSPVLPGVAGTAVAV